MSITHETHNAYAQHRAEIQHLLKTGFTKDAITLFRDVTENITQIKTRNQFAEDVVASVINDRNNPVIDILIALFANDKSKIVLPIDAAEQRITRHNVLDVISNDKGCLYDDIYSADTTVIQYHKTPFIALRERMIETGLRPDITEDDASTLRIGSFDDIAYHHDPYFAEYLLDQITTRQLPTYEALNDDVVFMLFNKNIHTTDAHDQPIIIKTLACEPVQIHHNKKEQAANITYIARDVKDLRYATCTVAQLKHMRFYHNAIDGEHARLHLYYAQLRNAFELLQDNDRLVHRFKQDYPKQSEWSAGMYDYIRIQDAKNTHRHIALQNIQRRLQEQQALQNDVLDGYEQPEEPKETHTTPTKKVRRPDTTPER